MGSFKNLAVNIFDDKDICFQLTLSTNCEREVDLDPLSDTFQEYIIPTESTYTSTVSIQPLESQDKGYVVDLTAEGISLKDVLLVFSKEKIGLEDRFEYEDTTYYIKKASPVSVGDGLGGREVAYYECLAVSKNKQTPRI